MWQRNIVWKDDIPYISSKFLYAREPAGIGTTAGNQMEMATADPLSFDPAGVSATCPSCCHNNYHLTNNDMVPDQVFLCMAIMFLWLLILRKKKRIYIISKFFWLAVQKVRLNAGEPYSLTGPTSPRGGRQRRLYLACCQTDSISNFRGFVSLSNLR